MTAPRCLRWPANSDRLCQLRKGHAGTCLTELKFPVRDISEHNPAWGKTA